MEGRSNKAKPVIISPEAQKDIQQIAGYLSSNWGEKVLNRFLQKLLKFYLVVSTNPHLFRYYNKHKNIRKFVITKHSILFYRNKRSVIEVLAVFDGRQKIATIRRNVNKRRN